MAAIFKPGNTAVITGGASGIGRALAKKCQSSGMKVLIADWNSGLLDSAAKTIGGGSDTDAVSTLKMDVSKTEDWESLRAAVDSQLGGKVSLLALNAGRYRPAGWEDPEAFRATFDTNFFGVVNGIAALLPAVKRAASGSGPAAVVITGSKQGITNPPGNPAYNASKAAVKSLAEGLGFDLRGEPDLSVHLLVPGWTFTGMTGSKEKPAGAWYPEQVVDHLVRKMDEGKFYVICPDNDVSEETDKKRMLWSAGDVVEGRPALTRWREDWKDKAKEWMDKQFV